MLKKIANILFSTRLTAVLFIAYAAAMAVGTFLDVGQSTSPTPYSRNLIYNAWWFEAIMVVFMINFVGNIFRYRLLRKEKWATLVLHLSFIFILLGAFITRYHGFEGMMAIREGATENTFLSQKTYITTYIDGDYKINGELQRLVRNDEVDFSPRLHNDYSFQTSYGNIPVSVELVNFISGAEEDIVPDDSGDYYLKLVEAGSGAPHNHFLKVGEVSSIHNVLYALNKPTPGAINITFSENSLTIESPFEGEYMTMATGTQGRLAKDSIQPLVLRSRYIIGNQAIVFPKPVIKGVFDVVKKSKLLKGDEDGIALKVSANGATKTVKLLGGQGMSNPFKQVNVGGLDFAFKYGSKILELPFDIKLNDFIADRYPGTEKSYSSFESKVTVFDPKEGDFDFHIYMNNILNHRGYRFFQSSFDPDEKGTILSVNHDYWGTWFTYLGYYLLYFGLMAILISRGTRMELLRKQLDKIKRKKAQLTILVFALFSLGINAQTTHTSEHQMLRPSAQQLDSILSANITPVVESDRFGKLVIQDSDGRMKPVNTYASELLRKLSKKDTYKDYTSNQVFLSMQESPQLWYNVPIIYLKPKKADTIRSLIGIPKEQKYAALIDFLDKNLNYKFGPFLEEAYSAQVPTAIQKEFKETDQRVSLLFNSLEGDALRLFPIPEDENNKWVSPKEFVQQEIEVKDSLYGNFIKTGFLAYLATLQNDKIKKSDFTQSQKLIEAIKKTQRRYGGEAMLSENKIETEITYNKYDIFKKLFSWYMYASSLMFVLLIVQILRDKSKVLKISVNIFKVLIYVCFGLHTAGLVVRWYISGHAPWSDAYESMIYVAWATMAFGVMLGQKSNLTFASTAFVTAMILMIAHWNWMDPTIGNLQPVLNSYWLMIHVAVIVGSYGPMALGMILGVISLLLMILTTSKNKAKMALNIKELTIINEMALTVGLVMLTIGNFLGGMWANESWGRYWGWDPKETWALISIMIYAFVIHMRLVPGLRSRLVFNIASILAFGSILMTYFGVNFYLAGLHSYAKDDQEISVFYILASLLILTIISVFASLKHRKYYSKKTS
ncbi:cytochrome c biogenesis protein CcsA [Flavobacteriaceae bacterium]|nr:cytochrome c biogenesis protein CcsA [Flavobacteriaceae bacterium]MDB2632072.1 cytochrome c biogenesis protein CcsA [Flavobacteriaceae bacterium]